MTKQNSSKKQLKHSHEGPSIPQQKSSFKPKKKGSEIDEIFAAMKRKKSENDKIADSKKPVRVSGANANAKSHDKMKMAKNGKSKSFKDNGSVGANSRSREKTADGLTIYTEEELGIGKSEAGDFNILFDVPTSLEQPRLPLDG